VRRASDNAEDSFTSNEVTDGTLAAFAGAGDAFVKQWWDQSGNARHGSQTTSANQPKLVSSGIVVSESGKPALSFDGSNDFFSVASPVSIGAAADERFFAFATYKNADATASMFLWQATDGTGTVSANTNHTLLLEGSVSRAIFGTGASADSIAWLNIGVTTEEKEFFAGVLAASSSTTGVKAAYRNSVLVAGGTYSQKAGAAANMTIGSSVVGTLPFEGLLQELIFYNTDQSATLDRITGNTMWYY
jgi:hypothetical protein